MEITDANAIVIIVTVPEANDRVYSAHWSAEGYRGSPVTAGSFESAVRKCVEQVYAEAMATRKPGRPTDSYQRRHKVVHGIVFGRRPGSFVAKTTETPTTVESAKTHEDQASTIVHLATSTIH
jgi:hypothetical protein